VIAERVPVDGAPTLVFCGELPALVVENTGTADIFVDYEEGELPDGLRLAGGERVTLPRVRSDVPPSLYATSTAAGSGEVTYYLPG
jgi:hypothetical protein